MTRRLRIEWAAGEKVTAKLALPSPARPTGVVLAHGAGAGQDHSFLVAVRRGLAAAGYPTLSFDYPYMEAGRRAPDRLPRLLQCHRAATDRLGEYVDRVVLAGKSMGGRVGSHLAGDDGYPAAALVYLGYPLVPVGKTEARPTGHLHRIPGPQLFVSGTRDRLAPLPLLESVVGDLRGATLVPVDGADHSYRVPKSTGLSVEAVTGRVIGIVTDWLEAVLGDQAGGGR